MNTEIIRRLAKCVFLAGSILGFNVFGQDAITNQGPNLATNSMSSAVNPSQILPLPAPASQTNLVLVQQGTVQQPASGAVTLQQIPTAVPPVSNLNLQH
jgi:hypothetical protein